MIDLAGPQSPKNRTNQDKINRIGSISGNQSAVELGFMFLFKATSQVNMIPILNNLPQTMLETHHWRRQQHLRHPALPLPTLRTEKHVMIGDQMRIYEDEDDE